MLVGNLFAILFSGLVTTLVSYMEYKNDPTNARFTWDHIKTQFAAIKSPKGPSPFLRKSPYIECIAADKRPCDSTTVC